MRWIMIAASAEIASHAERCGVHQVMVDLEVMGKAERQRSLDTHRSSHTLADVAPFARVLDRSELLVRVNPLGPHSLGEIDGALRAGADRLMLPMFTTAAEVKDFKTLVNGRAPITLLVETPQALTRLPSYIELLQPTDLVHFGLNDLTLGLGLSFVFEPVAGGLLDHAAALCQEHRIDFGIGGIGRLGTGELPAEVVMGELVRLGASWVILSRAFHGRAVSVAELEKLIDLEAELLRLAESEKHFRSSPAAVLEENRQRFAREAFALGVRHSHEKRLANA